MVNYVLGFMFNYDETHVVLIKKNKPSFMAGLLNGLGGKIETGEAPYDAMVREFNEEAGLKVQWNPLTSFSNPDGSVVFVYSCFTNLYHNVRQMEEEELVKVDINLVGTKGFECMSNIKAFIQQALENR